VDKLWVWCAVHKVQVATPKHKEGQVKREEEKEECDRRFEGAYQEDEGENEPALSQLVSFGS
jgi:hypothetical protein